MKYIFHIHSNINLIVASAIVKQQVINLKEVLFVCCRGVKSEFLDVETANVSDSIYLHPFNAPRDLFSFKFLKNDKVVSYIDGVIADFCQGNDFIYFAPHSKNSFYSVFHSNQNCKQVHYLEDGLDAYLEWEQLKKRFPVKNHWSRKVIDVFFSVFKKSHARRAALGGYLYKNIGSCSSTKFGLSSKSFPGFSNVEVVREDIIQSLQSYNMPSKSIIVLDALVEQHIVSDIDFFKFIEWLSNKLKANKSLSIKYHPAQTKQLRDKVTTLLLNEVAEVYVIPDNVCMELIFLENTNLNIYGVGSSLLNYGSLNSTHSVYACYRYFEEKLGIKTSRLSLWDTVYANNKDVSVNLNEI